MADLEKAEKITVNLGVIDLGEIDLLVREGFYATRTEFIRIAIRAQLATRGTAVEQAVARKTLVLGTRRFTCRELEEIRSSGRTIDIRVLGLASIAEDVPAELARATISSVEVLGAFRASGSVKAALADRMV